MPLSFEGLQKVGLVRFDDPGFVPGRDRLGKGQESMAPVKGGFLWIPQRQAAFLTDSPSFISSM